MKKLLTLIGCLFVGMQLKANPQLNLILLRGFSVKNETLLNFVHQQPEIFEHGLNFIESIPEDAYLSSDFIKLWVSLEKALKDSQSLQSYCKSNHLNFSKNWEKLVTKILLTPNGYNPYENAIISLDATTEASVINEWTKPLSLPYQNICGVLFPYLPVNTINAQK